MEEGEGRGDNKKMKSGKSKIQNQLVFCILYFALLIPPSLRDRRRYLVFELMSEREIDKWALLKEIRDSVFSLYGDVGVSESKIRLMEYTKREGTDRGMGILRCAHDKVEEVRAALACIHSANEASLSIRVIGTSGTIKGATRLL
jgi:ribonuclease P/MRP protein subunit POP5